MKDASVGVKIGCFGGFWGDSMARAVGQFLRSAEADSIDYLVSDYLAEVTMCILAKKKEAVARAAASGQAKKASARPPIGNGGSIEDFAKQIWRPFGVTLMDKGIKVVVNAGGLDPLGLKAAIEAISAKFPEGKRPIVAAVIGDDVLDRDVAFAPFELDGGSGVLDTIDRPSTFPDGSPRPLGKRLSRNAYLGCGGIVAALQAGAHVVVTGRVVDSALILGPLVHEHKWSLNKDWDQLAAGTLAGHIIECGAQCTGGNFTDWELALQLKGRGARLFENIGFPLVEVQQDGSFVVTKPSGTGGLVSRLSVAEQMVYEIGNPSSYIVADVVCDLTAVTLTEVGPHRVAVKGTRGTAATGFYKVSATYADGYMAHFAFTMVGPNALSKARAVSESIMRRAAKDLQAMGKEPYIATRREFLGARELSVNGGDPSTLTDEVIVRLSAHHSEGLALMLIPAQIPSASTGMAPGLFALSNARTAPSEAVALRSALVASSALPVQVAVSGRDALLTVASEWIPQAPPPGGKRRRNPVTAAFQDGLRPILAEPTVLAPLFTVACCRSGDKANAANVGVVCRDPEYLPHLLHQLTPERVKSHLRAWFDGDDDSATAVERFVLPGIAGFNFVLANVLGGGGAASLKVDKQGKSIGSLLSGMVLELPKRWVVAYEEGVGALKARCRARSKL